MGSQDSTRTGTPNETLQGRDALLQDAFHTHHKRSSSRLRVDSTKLLEPSSNKDNSQDDHASNCKDADVAAIGQRIRTLSLDADRARSEFLEAIARFDKLEGWRTTGARNCTAWMMSELGLCRSTAYREWKYARELGELPVIASHFAQGKLNWCKVRALLRVATPAEDHALAILAVDRSADDVQRLCDDYRFGKDPESDIERDRAQRERRSVTYSRCADGSLAIHVVLPPEDGAVLVRALEHREEYLLNEASLNKDAIELPHRPDASEGASEGASESTANGSPGDVGPHVAPRITARQRRADALVAVAHASLSGTSADPDQAAEDCAGAPATTAERHMVITHIDIEALAAAERQVASESLTSNAPLPAPLRAAIAGIAGGSISPATARRLACQSSLVTLIVENGEPIAVGRKHRLHTAAQRRAILARDAGRCTFPGCGATRHLDVHHMTLWRDGGDTSVSNGVTLCSACHMRVHDEGWQITRLPGRATRAQSSNGASDGANISTDTQKLHTQANDQTTQIVSALNKRDSRFQFERAGFETSADDQARGSVACQNNRCAESRKSYVVSRHVRPRHQTKTHAHPRSPASHEPRSTLHEMTHQRRAQDQKWCRSSTRPIPYPQTPCSAGRSRQALTP